MLIKLVDLFRCQRRATRQPYLIGKVGEFWIMLIDRHEPKADEPVATLFIGGMLTAKDNKPLPPVWDAKAGVWIGPAHPDYPGFYDDTKAGSRST